MKSLAILTVGKMFGVVKSIGRGLIEETYVLIIGNPDLFLKTKMLVHLFISNVLLLHCSV